MKYEVRYFFDYGSGICLWAKNDAAREKFDYAIDHNNMEISENTKRWLQYLIAWFDTSLDWDSPPNTLWSDQEYFQFKQAALKGLELLRADLREPQWQFFDECEF